MRRPDWTRPLPRPLRIPDIMTLTTLADVRELLRHVPKDRRALDTWRHVADALKAETDGLPWRKGGRTLYRRVTTAAIELLLFTGCRLSEVLNLRWAQVAFDAGTIALPETKAGRPQVVTMNAPARQVLKELHAARGSGTAAEWVLPAQRKARGPVAKSGLEAAWRRIRTAAQLDDVRLHDLRHTVGTYAGQSGANAFLVRDLLRHKNLAMSMKSVRSSRGDEARLLEQAETNRYTQDGQRVPRRHRTLRNQSLS